MDRLTSMSVFVRVAELGSFTDVADEFEISATMVGKHIKELEARLGARLIHRTTRRQQLTDVGRLYYDRCKAVLDEVAAADASIDTLRGVARGMLRVTASVTYGARKIAPALIDFLREHPEVRVELVLNDRVADLIEEGFDAAIRIGRLSDSGLIARPLAPYRMMICAAPSYLAAHPMPRRPQDLEKHSCLAYWSQQGRWKLIDRHGREYTVRADSHLRTNNGEALRQAALAGFGIVYQPQVLLENDIRTGRLIQLLKTYQAPAAPVHLVYLPDRRPTPKLQRFIDFILSRFEKPEPLPVVQRLPRKGKA
ncbi:LysR family transcriptional regulator [Dyella sp. M7H15-1]|uniref:LysR family transcriptional regulator n=1 Tax=Dyella sp. M7H15-1 TaxID=2501295 RepID=UPI001004F87C|nr:LysR family transcriptional regulator [Dyella sp. M7H15-1]QAU22808.1 LysR family transcriptional regulator [Dyella sp. M7H15-1]